MSFLFLICFEIDRLNYLQCMFSIHKTFSSTRVKGKHRDKSHVEEMTRQHFGLLAIDDTVNH